MYSSSGARVWNQRIWMCFNPENFLFWCVCVCECIYVCVMCVWVYTRECDVCVTMCMCVMCVCVRMYRIYPNIACKLASFLLLHPHECWGCQLSHHPQSSLASHEARWIHVKRKGVVVKIQTFQYLLCSKMSFFFLKNHSLIIPHVYVMYFELIQWPLSSWKRNFTTKAFSSYFDVLHTLVRECREFYPWAGKLWQCMLICDAVWTKVS